MKAVKLLLFISVIFLVACDGFKLNSARTDSITDENEKIILDFWTFWGSEDRRPIIDSIITDFNESQDEIEVHHTYIPWSDIWTKNLASIAAGDPPDIIINDINTVRLRAEKGQIEPITEFVAEDTKDRFYDHLMDASTYNDEIYALPFNTDTQILFYNDDHLTKAGLPTGKAPATWDELNNYGDKLDILSEDGESYERVGFYPLIGTQIPVWIANALGENYVTENKEINIDTPLVKDTFEWILNTQDKYGKQQLDSVNSQFENAQQDPFMAGNISMMVQNANYYVELRSFAQDLNFKVAALPEKEPGSGHTSVGGGFVAEVPKGAANPEASYKFIEFLTNYDSQLYWAENNFDLVAHKEAGEAAVNSESFNEKDQEVYNMMIENMNETILTPQPSGAPDYINSINPIFEGIVAGSKDVDDGLSEAQTEMERLMEIEK